jgi:hypothetical protein
MKRRVKFKKNEQNTFLFSSPDEEEQLDRAKLDYEIEHIHEPPAERLGFDLFSYFRKKSVDRPRSALAYLQQKRSSPLPEVSTSRKSSEVRAGDIMHLLRKASIESDSSRGGAVDLPQEALENLSAEEREHIMRVMNSASRAHTTPQQSRR